MDPRSGCINAQDQVKDSTFSQKGKTFYCTPPSILKEGDFFDGARVKNGV